MGKVEMHGPIVLASKQSRFWSSALHVGNSGRQVRDIVMQGRFGGICFELRANWFHKELAGRLPVEGGATAIRTSSPIPRQIPIGNQMLEVDVNAHQRQAQAVVLANMVQHSCAVGFWLELLNDLIE